MTAVSSLLDGLPDQMRDQLELLLLEFDKSWTPDGLDRAISELPSRDKQLHRATVAELIKIDMERHWQQGARPIVEDYLSRFPAAGAAVAELAAAEFEIRRESGAAVSPETLTERFPEHASTVRLMIQQAWERESDIIPQWPCSETSRLDETVANDPQAAASTGGSRTDGTQEVSLHQTVEEEGSGEKPLSGTFGRYRIEGELGRGAMGAVYLAWDTILNRKVAIKTPKFDRGNTQELIDRFLQEARAAATLDHRGICPVHDFGQIDGRHYICMAYVEGRTLAEVISREEAVAVRAAVNVIRRIARALEDAHSRDVVHRDLKPGNVMINRRREPLVMDFGLARQMNQRDDCRITRDGTLLGTPAYMSPEQVEGQQDRIGPQTDIYSLGVILYELLTGELPFQGSAAAVMGAIATQEPRPPSELRPEVDSRLQDICSRMMAKELSSRYRSMADVARDLTAWLRESHYQEHLPPAGSSPSAEGEPADLPGQESFPAHTGAVTPPPASRTSEPQQPPLRENPAPRNGFSSYRPAYLAGLLAAGILLGVVFVVRTPEGTLQVEVDAPGIEVLIDGETVELTDSHWKGKKKAERHRLALRLNGTEIPFDQRQKAFAISEGRLRIRLGEVDLESQYFEVARKGTTVLAIRFEATDRPAGDSSQPGKGPSPAVAPFDADRAKQHQQVWAKHLGLPVERTVELPDGVELTMVLIPPGEFLMGSPASDATADRDEVPLHRVRLTLPFYLQSTEVTQAQWQAVMQTTPWAGQVHAGEGDDFAASYLSWEDAQEFCRKLSETDGNSYRLPTEAEWEYACRAGTTTRFSFGNDISRLGEYAWFQGNTGKVDEKYPHQSRKKLPNAWGLYDMHGNVWEWCQDWYDGHYYRQFESRTAIDPQGASPESSIRVIRGASWLEPGIFGHSADRGRGTPDRRIFAEDYRLDTLGFRIVRELPDVERSAAGTTAATAADASNIRDSGLPVSRAPVAVNGGEWVLEDDELVQTRPVIATLLFGDRGWTDYDMLVETMTISDEPISNGGRQLFRVDDIDNCHNLVLGSYGGKWIEAIHHVHGVWGRDGTLMRKEHESERWYGVHIRVRGSRFTCWLDKQLLFDFRSSHHPQGCIGLGTWDSAVRWRNLRVLDPEGKVLWKGFPDLSSLRREE